jgi:hypothetical protein
MPTFLFWNLNRQARVDVLMLAECVTSVGRMLLSLNRERAEFHYNASPVPTGIEIYSRFASSLLRPLDDDARMTVRHLQLPARTDVLLGVVHLRSKLHQSAESQGFACVEVARRIADLERQIGHRHTILAGDFNMNPFESGLVSANGLNAVMDRSVAARGERTVQGTVHPFFYNPMWSRFGDGSPGPSGTYYRDSGEHVTFFWNMFDQVLLRPELLARFRSEDLEILDSDGDASLLTPKGRPSRTKASDHLPVLFRLSL